MTQNGTKTFKKYIKSNLAFDVLLLNVARVTQITYKKSELVVKHLDFIT